MANQHPPSLRPNSGDNVNNNPTQSPPPHSYYSWNPSDSPPSSPPNLQSSYLPSSPIMSRAYSPETVYDPATFYNTVYTPEAQPASSNADTQLGMVYTPETTYTPETAYTSETAYNSEKFYNPAVYNSEAVYNPETAYTREAAYNPETTYNPETAYNPAVYNSEAVYTPETVYNSQTFYTPQAVYNPNYNSDTVYPVTSGQGHNSSTPATFVSTPTEEKKKKKSGYRCNWLLTGVILALLLIVVGAVMFATAKPIRSNCFQTCRFNNPPIRPSALNAFNKCVAGCRNSYRIIRAVGIALMCIGNFLAICCMVKKLWPRFKTRTTTTVRG
ncbi:890_t:CDS:1 [Paraglomus brasilianum]|uniref:890_t:CDS:1 n=1 Tax=Paraglomus brasilianum TaxID=144538 RepID=A0A9N9BMD6_9GLOM|nr:890_t:CDS:1 [Paraglomus brasilianum]